MFIMRKSLLFLALILAIHATWAQSAHPKVFKASKAATVVLRDLDDKYGTAVFSLEAADPDGMQQQAQLQAVKQQEAAHFPRKLNTIKWKATSSVPAPVVSYNFVADSNTGVPPDNYMAINNNSQAVSVTNTFISVHNATTGAYTLRKGLEPLSASVGLNSLLSDYRYDPKVVYDPEADRFICVMLNAIDSRNYIVLGFSQTNDPTGSWNFYKFYGDYMGDTTWFDYPAISITHNEFFLTGNKIKYDSSWQAGFIRTVIYQVRKQDGYNGDTALTYQIWDSVAYNGSYIRCLYPLNAGDGVQGPAQYFLSDRDFDVLNDSFFLVKIPDTIGSSGALTVTPVVSSLSYGVPPDARQPDTSLSLATNDNRVLGGFITANEIQFVATSVNPLNGSSGIFHGVISNYATSPSLTGRIFSIDTLDLGYPNISYAGNTGGANQSILSFNYSGPNTFPAFGAIFFDGTGFSDMVTIRKGDSTISMLAQKQQRWGDYSGSQPLWSGLGAVWVEGIFGTHLRKYGNYMAELRSPYYTAVPTQVKTPSYTKLYPNPTLDFVNLEFSLDEDQVVDFIICDISGRVVDHLPRTFCHDGRNLIQFNSAPLAPGIYFIKCVGQKGEQVTTSKFIRQ